MVDGHGGGRRRGTSPSDRSPRKTWAGPAKGGRRAVREGDVRPGSSRRGRGARRRSAVEDHRNAGSGMVVGAGRGAGTYRARVFRRVAPGRERVAAGRGRLLEDAEQGAGGRHVGMPTVAARARRVFYSDCRPPAWARSRARLRGWRGDVRRLARRRSTARARSIRRPYAGRPRRFASREVNVEARGVSSEADAPCPGGSRKRCGREIHFGAPRAIINDRRRVPHVAPERDSSRGHSIVAHTSRARHHVGPERAQDPHRR